MSEVYEFVRDVGPQDWAALPRPMKAGERVTRFVGHTYGIDRDDAEFLGRETVCCVLDGRDAFFTVPVEFLRRDDGEKPMGNYLVRPLP